MGGIVGRLFREFAVTLSTAILVSMIVSLTTTPARFTAVTRFCVAPEAAVTMCTRTSRRVAIIPVGSFTPG